MPDDKTKTTPHDTERVNVHDDYEVRYWCRKFGCAAERLRTAVRKVGVMAKDVEKELIRR